jgi:hypothetical protein
MRRPPPCLFCGRKYTREQWRRVLGLCTRCGRKNKAHRQQAWCKFCLREHAQTQRLTRDRNRQQKRAALRVSDAVILAHQDARIKRGENPSASRAPLKNDARVIPQE